MFDVVILGAGPAGVAAALGLCRLGYSTAIVSRRRMSSVEGLSARALASLTEAGLADAAACASEPARRVVYWAGQTSQRGQECLIRRERFDSCLRASVRDMAVHWMEASIRGVRFANDVWEVETTCGSIRGRTVLEARGRNARRSDCRGPLLVAWNVTQQSDELGAPASAVAALDDGWCWVARTGDGVVSLQLVGVAGGRLGAVDGQPGAGGQLGAVADGQPGAAADAQLGAAGQLPPTDSLAQRIQAAARALPEFGLAIDRLAGLPAAAGHARAAVARYSQPSRGQGFLRIGDAAVAMDPLSGNGIHEAVRSARVAVAAVNSYLLGTPWSVVARFVDERARELWRRSVTAAAGFYRLQADWAGSGFWTSAAQAYEQAAQAALPQEQSAGHFEMRPVLDGERIDLRQVWVSARWPRGVWKVDGRSVEQVLRHEVFR